MSDYKIKVDLELSEDLKESIDTVMKIINELQCKIDELTSDINDLKGEK